MSELYIAPVELPSSRDVTPVRVVDQAETAILAMTAMNHISTTLYGVPASAINKEVGVESPMQNIHQQLKQLFTHGGCVEFDSGDGEIIARSIAFLAIQSPSFLAGNESTSAFSAYVLEARYFLTHRAC